MMEMERYRDLLDKLDTIYPDKIALSVQETASVLGVDRRTVTALIASKKLHALSVGRGKLNNRFIIAKTAIARYLAS